MQKYKEETGNEVEVWGTVGDAYASQLQAKLAANEGATIFSIATGAEAEKFKSILRLSNEPFVQYIAPNMALEIDGKIVGVPYGVEGFGLVYNKSLVDPKDVTDLASFTQTLEKLKAEGINGMSLSQEAYFLIGHIINTPFALQPDPQAFIEKLNKGEVKMAETKEFQEFAKFTGSHSGEHEKSAGDQIRHANGRLRHRQDGHGAPRQLELRPVEGLRRSRV